MPARSCFRLTSLRAAAVAVTLLGSAAVPASAALATAAAPALGPASVAHFNVAQAHSPQLLRQLAAVGGGPLRASSGPALRAPFAAAPASLPGAVQGVDVASYQEKPGIQWAQAAAGGIQFTAIKVTEGAYYVNPYAGADLAAAKAAGLATTAYAFAIPNGGGKSASPVAQADYLLAHAAGPDGAVPSIMLDIEYDPYDGTDGTNQCYGLSKSAMGTWISAFGTEILAKTGRLPVIYSTKGWWAACVASTTFSQYPLWVADYTTAAAPGIPAGWATWNLWQYTSTGTVAGIADAGSTDLDQLNPAALTILNPGNQQAAEQTPTSLQLHASMPGLSYSESGLPPGLTLDASTGQVSGSASAAGGYPVTIKATDPTSLVTASVSFTWYVRGTLVVAQPASQHTVQGYPADFAVRASDSVAGQALSFTATGLPPGVSVSTAGQVTGWPTKPGSFQVTVTARDNLEATGTATFGWTVSLAPDSGPAGTLRSALAGDCLEDVGNGSASGTQAGLWPCHGSSAQHWTSVQDGTLRIHGMCLTVPGTKAASGSKVELTSCSGAVRQQWQPEYPRAISASLGASPTTLINPWSRMCLAVPGRATGTRAVIRSCAGSAAQSWALPAGSVRSEMPGKCLDDSGGGTASGNKIDVSTCAGSVAQRWTLEPDGTMRVRGRCLAVNHQGKASGTPVGLQACDRTGSQLWHLTPEGPGVVLVNPRSSRCLTDPNAASVNGTRLVIEPCAATPGKVWRPA